MSATTVARDPIHQMWINGAQARLEEARQSGNPAAEQAALEALWEVLLSVMVLEA